MRSINDNQKTYRKKVSRKNFLEILNSAIKLGEYKFARNSALNWLSVYPGDLDVSYIYTKAYFLAGGKISKALTLLDTIISLDPLFIRANQFAWEISSKSNLISSQNYKNNLYIFGLWTDDTDIDDWAKNIASAKKAIAINQLQTAERELLHSISANPPSPLPALTHIELMDIQALNQPSIRRINLTILEHYAQRWEKCLQIRIKLADAYMDGSQSERGVKLLHNIVADDLSGNVIRRLYGSKHKYLEMWPKDISGEIDSAFPASIAAWYGINLLEDFSGQNYRQMANSNQNLFQTEIISKNNPKTNNVSQNFVLNQQTSETVKVVTPTSIQKTSAIPEILIPTQETLNHIANKIHRSEVMKSDGRFPVYFLITNKGALEKQYHQQGYYRIFHAMKELELAVNRKKNWRAQILLVDDPKSTSKFSLKPITGNDPWEIKLMLSDLDNVLAAHGEMIGALAIIGGPGIIPFHLLPNPVDDNDLDIPSDSPYASKDENYFVPEWPVGRFPGDASNFPEPLINSLVSAKEYHEPKSVNQSKFRQWFEKLLVFLHISPRDKISNFGYSAAIWKEAAEAVFSTFGKNGKMMISPPSTTTDFRKNGIDYQFAYFNLHGIQESPDWFGHKDPEDIENIQDYPTALTPADIIGNKQVPSIVFSEACFGAHIFERDVDSGIPLKFLAIGTGAFIGSTSTAYGAVKPPLTAADLLGKNFWKYVQRGVPAGEALRRSKIDLIQEMDQRQGYLDGEDQKTLISFVLYGDPLLNPTKVQMQPKAITRPIDKPVVHTICEKAEVDNQQQLPEEIMWTVKQLVGKYLPGMIDAKYSVRNIRPICEGGKHDCISSRLKFHAKSSTPSNRQVVMMKKQISGGPHTHFRYARLTFDPHGKLIRMSVSR